MERRTIARGTIDVTIVGYGGAPIGNIFGAISSDDAQQHIEAAWNSGIRSFDTAPMYGHGLSEHRLGHALLDHDRDEYVLSTKVGRTLIPARRGTFDTGVWVNTPPFRAEYDYSYDAVLRQVDDSLQRMCQDRFDILFVHDIDHYTHGDNQPERFEEAVAGAFPALIRLRDEGVVRAIGAGVNDANVLVDLVKRVDVDVLLLAGRYTLLEQGPVADLFPLCAENQVSVLLGGVFNSGILATGPTPGALFNYAPASPEILGHVARLEAICQRHGVPLPAAAIQFAIAHPVVGQIVLGSRTIAQQAINLRWLEEPIPTDFWSDCKQAGLIDPHAPTPS
ncbi:MAG: aldo/keto reductase [Nakamurella sp.]